MTSTELAPHYGWDDGGTVAKMYIRDMNAALLEKEDEHN